MSNGIKKWYLKQWAIAGYFQYEIYQVVAGNLIWFEATPKTDGCVTRTANTEQELRLMLENDCLQIIKSHQRKRIR